MTNTPSERKALCCVGLRWQRRRLQQLIRYQVTHWEPLRPRIEVVELWEDVPGKHRNIGRPRKYNHIQWQDVDWRENNNEIGRRLKIAPGIVADYRERFGKPAEPIATNRNRVVSDEQIRAIDWEGKTDVVIARELRVTRERIRQLRNLHGKRSRVHHLYGESLKAMQWLLAHRSDVEGKHIHDVARMVPARVRTTSLHALLRRTGFKFVHSRRWKFDSHSQFAKNMELPNIYLAMIWRCSSQCIANRRCKELRGKAKWQSMGFSRCTLDPHFLRSLREEMARAEAAGVAVDRKKVWDYVRARNNAIHAQQLQRLLPTTQKCRR